ncbi:ribosomal protein S25 [Leishmania mexicana MHOM/GT/2001/U1103]|uniref:40S ribosomal protein S25 n=1 Tax=Leishmania mexicana (strain MHOM/GT/2001/U1103) TaxID=929439 RepID=E9B4L2_LEIMU|nr:ribosomal protein S25 [Leishmania mexicana MHOM/GT/2001/U1103]CBZ30181.1 ribosomal protein S25 [Leishmania mexicana MHOM/GT/2001/U1103]
MPPKAGQTKKAKMEAANKGAKKTTKKWSKGQSREALQNAVMFDKETYDKLRSEVPKYKLITPSIISDRLKIAVSIAASGLKQLCREKLIRLVSCSSKTRVYTRIVQAAPADAAAAAPAAE